MLKEKAIEILPEDTPHLVKGPLTGDEPVYLYLSPCRGFLLYSKDLKALFASPKVEKPLEVSEEGISFLLQSGVVPTPYTIFKNLFVLSIGDEVEIKREGEYKLNLSFSHRYYYFHCFREKEGKPDTNTFLELIKEALSKRVLRERDIFLFHSAGKDSNILALALAESDFKDKTLCITLKGPSHKDESSIAKELAKRMGLKHYIFELPEKITPTHIDFLREYFKNMLLPCTDGVSLVYPFYAMKFNFKGSYLIDGSGVDVFAGHIPRRIEFERQRIFSKFSFLRPLAERLPTGNFLQSITLTKSEWVGLSGFTFSDTKSVFPQARSVHSFWKEEDKKRKNWDYFDLKGDIWATYVEYGNVMRKVRILAEFSEANLIFPFTDEKVALYLAKLPEKELFDRRNFQNKLFFRKILKEKLDYEADKPRKFSYPADIFSLIMKMEDYVKEELFSCSLWEKKGLSALLKRLLKEVSSKDGSISKRAKNLLIRLFLLSAWYNNTHLINTKGD